MSRAGGPVIPNHGVLASAPRAYAHQFNALADRQPDDGAQSRSWEAQGKRSERIKGGISAAINARWRPLDAPGKQSAARRKQRPGAPRWPAARPFRCQTLLSGTNAYNEAGG